jgi:hypothetical protein
VAAAASLTPGHHAHRRQWRYTWEALGHLPLLRLYLFPLPAHPDAVPSDPRLDGSLLILSFSLAGKDASLRVPVPRVLVDPSAPVECRAAGDHVEVRLAVDHPVAAAAFPPAPGTERPAPLTLLLAMPEASEIDSRTTKVEWDMEDFPVLLSSRWIFD